MQMYLRRCIPDKSHLSFFHENSGLCFRGEVKRIVQETSEVSESLSGLSSKNRFQVLNPLSRGLSKLSDFGWRKVWLQL